VGLCNGCCPTRTEYAVGETIGDRVVNACGLGGTVAGYEGHLFAAALGDICGDMTEGDSYAVCTTRNPAFALGRLSYVDGGCGRNGAFGVVPNGVASPCVVGVAMVVAVVDKLSFLSRGGGCIGSPLAESNATVVGGLPATSGFGKPSVLGVHSGDEASVLCELLRSFADPSAKEAVP